MKDIKTLIKECKALVEQTEPFQQKMKAKHSRLKKKVIGGGGQKNTPPFTQKPSMERSKSAPPIGEIKFKDFNVRNKWIEIDPEILKQNKKEKDEDKNINDEFFDILNKSYSYLGGHIDFQKPSDIPSNHTGWTAIDADLADYEPDALRVYKIDKFGNVKLTAGGSDGTPEGKKAYIEKTASMLNTPNTYAEMSDAIAHIMITRHNISSIDDKEVVQKILGSDRKIKWIGADPSGKYPDHKGWYVRELGGKPHKKIMLGNVSNINEIKDVLHGGKGDYKPDSDFDPIELKKGIKHEFEHTKNKKLAKEIAKDHLSEDPKYYTHLKKAGVG